MALLVFGVQPFRLRCRIGNARILVLSLYERPGAVPGN